MSFYAMSERAKKKIEKRKKELEKLVYITEPQSATQALTFFFGYMIVMPSLNFIISTDLIFSIYKFQSLLSK